MIKLQVKFCWCMWERMKRKILKMNKRMKCIDIKKNLMIRRKTWFSRRPGVSGMQKLFRKLEWVNNCQNFYFFWYFISFSFLRLLYRFHFLTIRTYNNKCAIQKMLFSIWSCRKIELLKRVSKLQNYSTRELCFYKNLTSSFIKITSLKLIINKSLLLANNLNCKIRKYFFYFYYFIFIIYLFITFYRNYRSFLLTLFLFIYIYNLFNFLN